MATLERTYIIPLRREWLKAPKYKRAKRAVNALKNFLCRHMKVEKHLASKQIKLGPKLNLEIWKRGIKNPPPRVKVNVSKNDKGIVYAELFGAPKFEEKKAAPEEKKGMLAKVAEAVTGKAAPAKKPAVKPAETPATTDAAAEKPAVPKKTANKATAESALEKTVETPAANTPAQ